MILKNILIVGLGGFIGSILRYMVYLSILSNASPKLLFSWSTFAVNIIGCFLMGLFWGMSDTYNWFSEEFRLLLMVGICGGFTTFSSYALDAIIIGKENLIMSLIYLISSIVVGIIFVFLGHALIRAMV